MRHNTIAASIPYSAMATIVIVVIAWPPISSISFSIYNSIPTLAFDDANQNRHSIAALAIPYSSNHVISRSVKKPE